MLNDEFFIVNYEDIKILKILSLALEEEIATAYDILVQRLKSCTNYLVSMNVYMYEYIGTILLYNPELLSQESRVTRTPEWSERQTKN